MPDGSFPVEVVEGVPVVTAPEEIDITNAAALRSALLQAAANGHGTLVVDMSQTRFCDSSGLHTLLAAHKRARSEGRELLLVIPSPAVLRVFVLTGVDKMIPRFARLAEALVAANGHRGRLAGHFHEPVGGSVWDPPADGHRRRACHEFVRGTVRVVGEEHAPPWFEAVRDD
jgi:anti-sigma B factor antagonist